MFQRLIATLIVCSATLAPAAAFAQSSSFAYDESKLTVLFQAYLKKNKNDSYLEKRIAEERLKVRAVADKEIKQIVSQGNTDDANDKTALPKAIDRQRSIVSSLEEPLHERKVDLDLLKEEEKKFYLSPSAGSGSNEEFRLTKTYPELLAKKTILEERIGSLETALPLQRDRQNKLSTQQTFEQFSFLFSFLSYLLIIVVGVAVDRLLRRLIVGKIDEKGKRYLISKVMTASIYCIVILWLLSKFFADHPNAIASIALIGAGIAVAMQDIVKDIVGWFVILQKRPYTLGDRVSIGESTGDVIDISLLRTTMLEVSTAGVFNAHERTGKTLYVPNSMIIKEHVLNYNTTSDFMNAEMQVTVSYESNWHKADRIIRETLAAETMAFAEQAKRQHRKRTAFFYSASEVGEPQVHTDIAQSGILFTLKFIVPIGQRRDVVTRMSRTILERFQAEPDIQIAFNTLRIISGK